jgi:ribosomal protein S18 acetylase RimI-like enzyme
MAHVPPPEVVPVARKDSASAGAVLGRAFYPTAQWAAVIPDPSVRQRKLEQMFTGTIRLMFAAHGIAEMTSGDEAVALWLPPGRSLGLWPFVKSGFASARFAVTPPFPNLRRVMAMMNQFDETHHQQMPDPHWYLLALGVDPDHQRGGLGSALVRHGIERSDRDYLPIYLETEMGPNVTFYETLGFEVRDHMTVTAYGLSFSLMVHQPQPQ